MNCSSTLLESHQNNDVEKPVDYYFDLVCQYAPAIKKSLVDHGGTCIDDYAEQYPMSMEEGFQKKNDLFEIVHDYLLPLHGSAIACQTVQDLTDIPCGLTANHHGVDFFAQSVQGSLLFSLILSGQNPKCRTVPVFACANVPLNNLTYPRGILVYNAHDNHLSKMPQKIPIFSDSAKNSTVSVTGPIEKSHIQRAVKRVDKMALEGRISSQASEIIHDVLENEYADPYIQGLKDYSEQSVVLNQQIWKKMHAHGQNAVDLIYMELEKIVCRLLQKDLHDPKSLISTLMFNPTVRTSLINGLDGKDACWQEDKLEKRLNGDLSDIAVRKYLGNCGTHFFWGVDRKKKLIPMYLENNGNTNMILKGKDDRGEVYSLSFDPSNLVDALNQNYLLPSLFTSYTALSLARGIVCIGGYYQSSYLPVMQKNVVDVLKKTAGFETAADQVRKVKTARYLSGMQTIMTRHEDHSLIPAGPVEIMAGGGIDKAGIDQIKKLTIRDAHLASLLETIPDVVPYEARTKDWHQDISKQCHTLLNGKIVIL